MRIENFVRKGLFFLAVDIHKLYRNVRLLAKHRNVPINILEENLGVELGYFARAENKELVLPAGTVAKVADILDCTADMLTRADITKFTDVDFCLNDFFLKLGKETQDGSVVWSKGDDGCCKTSILSEKDLYISGAPVNGSWGNLRIWMQNSEQVPDSTDTETPAADTGEPAPSDGENLETEESTSDTASETAETQDETPKKKEYVVYDARKTYHDAYIHKHARDTAVLIEKIVDQPIDQETIALVKQFLEKADATETTSA